MPDFDAKFEAWLAKIQEKINAYYARHYPTQTPTMVPDRGRKYVRVWSRDPGCTHRGTAWAFVEIATGDIYKPATWRAPAKHSRGNIGDETGINGCGPYGPFYISGPTVATWDS